MRLFRQCVRLPLIALHILVAMILTLTLVRRPDAQGLPGMRARRLAQFWYRVFCRLIGVHVHVHGMPASGVFLGVSNHVSWLDIPVLGTHQSAGFLSKAEVAGWPVIGWLAGRNGTIFIERGAQGAAGQVKETIRTSLSHGGSVHIFPEGTTTRGETVAHFHSRLFLAALEAGCPVQPVTLIYRPIGGRPSPAAFVDDARFLPHALRLLGEARLDVDLIFLPPIECPEHCNSRALARAAQQAVAEALTVSAQSLSPEV